MTKKTKQKTLKSFEELGPAISFKAIDEKSYYGGKFISIQQVVKDFTRNEQGQQALDKLNKS